MGPKSGPKLGKKGSQDTELGLLYPLDVALVGLFRQLLRNCLKRSASKTPEHQTGHRDVDESLAALG